MCSQRCRAELQELPSRAAGLTSLHTADGLTLLHFQWLLCILWDVLVHDLSSPSGSQAGSAVPSALLLALPHPRTSSIPASVLSDFGKVYWKAFFFMLEVLNPKLQPHFSGRGEQSHNSVRRMVLVRNLKWKLKVVLRFRNDAFVLSSLQLQTIMCSLNYFCYT